MPTIIWINGKYQTREEASVSVFDHGLLYGDGVFEGIRAYGGRVFRLADHIDRLYSSAKSIWLDPGMSQAEMRTMVEEAQARSGIKDSYIRLVITRGIGDLGMDPRKCEKPTVFCIVDTIALWSKDRYERGLTCITAATPISHKENLSPRVKSLNYLSHILAKIEGIAANVDEVVMLDSSGYVAEASGMNLFCARRGVVRTPPPYSGILRGVTRDAMMEMARDANYEVVEEPLNRYDLYSADEVFLTGTAAEIVAVTKLDGRVIGNGQSGPIVADLSRRFRALVTRGD
ncbi:MAG TPA: branched-chain-amino-acid transaminase [Gemmatimonadales bacterium]|jgi:branched-chain amino acid aminotransferase|nr:branched-chain-amino-acid transaminase [Gemmatimonadales bacterium]